MQGQRLELKVCEGCGALWLRDAGDRTVYCARCSRRLAMGSVLAWRPYFDGRDPGLLGRELFLGCLEIA